MIALIARIGRKFVDAELAELLSFSHYLTLVGGIIWLVGFFIHKYNDRKLKKNNIDHSN
ncbi:hypothetical protein [Maribacter thermophilus]|uniref:hypothetical protein n=1 Tax=Maribacter thermophilus TaxID=1197874 RepID=UPI0012FAAE1E|nr:hypothetical protein [Maribacter thermophilus]